MKRPWWILLAVALPKLVSRHLICYVGGMSMDMTTALDHPTPKQRGNTVPPNWVELKGQAAEQYQAGASFSQICRALAEMGVALRPTKMGLVRLKIPRERMEELVKQGFNVYRMARELGVSNRGVNGLLARYGLVAAQPERVRKELAEQGLLRCSDCREIKSLATDYYFCTGNGRVVSRCKVCSKKLLRDFRLRQLAQKRAARAAKAASGGAA